MKFSRKVLIAAIALGLTLGVSATSMAQALVPADTVVYGTIYTSNPQQEVVDAFAVKDGKYIYVGDRAGAEAYIASNTNVIDKQTGMIMAGATEGHGHYILQSAMQFMIPSKAISLAELKPQIEAYIAANSERPAYLGWGWSRENDLVPNTDIDYTAFLDALCSDKPLLLMDCDGHQAIANTKALEMICSTGNIKLVDPERGREDNTSIPGGIVLRLADGRANGYMRDQPGILGMRLVGSLCFTAAEYDQIIMNMQKLLYEQGYTNYNDGCTNVTGMAVVDAMYKADAADEIKINIRPHYNPLVYELHNKAVVNNYLDEITKFRAIKSKHILPAGIKIFADGVTESQTGLNNLPYVGTDNYGNEVTDEATMYMLTKAANERGIGIHSHSYGNAGVHATINAFIKAQNEVNNGTRNDMCHVKNVLLEDFQRMADNNIGVALNINWHRPYTKELIEITVKEELQPESIVNDSYPTGDLIKYGVVTTSSTDAPAHNDFPSDVFGIMEQAVNPKALNFLDGLSEFMKQKMISIGYTKENLQHAEITNAYQCVPVKTGIDIMTINGAKFMGIDQERGSIEEGKYADFIMVDQNVLDCALDDIHKTKVEKVFFEGEEVYRK